MYRYRGYLVVEPFSLLRYLPLAFDIHVSPRAFRGCYRETSDYFSVSRVSDEIPD
jgi:hypothetical protein